MKNIIEKIINKHRDLFENAQKYKRINIGFTNTIYSIDNYILKICANISNEDEFAQEINFYRNNNTEFMPKLYGFSVDKREIPYHYIIIEKLEGCSLFDIWHKLNEPERESIVKQIVDIMKYFHKIEGKAFDWSSYIGSFVKEYMIELKNINQLNNDEINLINKVLMKFDKYLYSEKFVFIHNDLHFDNIFYKDGKIKIIDFESSRYAPVDKELEIIFRMSKKAYKYMNEKNEKYYNSKYYHSLLSYFEKYYPEAFDVSHLAKRMAIYDLRDSMELYTNFDKEYILKEEILEACKYILE